MSKFRRDKSRDGLGNRFQLHVLTHYRPVWWVVGRIKWLNHLVNTWLIDQAIYKVPTRPHPFSTMAPYTSWDSLTDRTWMGRHLAPDPVFNHPSTLPSSDEVVDLFRMRTEHDLLSPKSTVLFPYFVQWFSDGFLRVMSDPNDDKSVDPSNPALGSRSVSGTIDERLRMRTTSNHQIDLSPVYGITKTATDKLRSGEAGKLKSQFIHAQEYPPFYYKRVQRYPKVDLVDPQFEGVYRPSLLERIQPPERKAKLFATGVDRGNAQIGFAAINTICLREHNRLCDAMADRYPDWDDERLFQTARNTLIGIIARIVVEEYINHIKPYHFDFLFDPLAFRRQRWYRQNWMTVEFSMVYRWHMALPSILHHGGREIPMEDTLFNNQMLIDTGPGSVLGEASSQPGGRIGLHNTPDFLLHLEETTIQWGRESQLRSYNDYRAYCGFPRVTEFAQITSDPEVQRELKVLYGDVDAIEFYVGILAEDLRTGSALSPLMGRLIGVDAFSQALTSPLLAERVFNPATFSEVGWQAIQETGTLEDLVHRNVSESERRFNVTFNRSEPNQH